MKAIKRTLLCVLTLFAFSATAASPVEYKSGPSLTFFNTGTVGVGYYFLKNNSLNIDVQLSPLFAVRNTLGVQNNNFNQSSVGACVNLYAPIKRNKFNNRLFFQTGVLNTVWFGIGDNFTPYHSDWGIAALTGFQWRFNRHVYMTVRVSPFSYERVQYKSNPNIEHIYTVLDWGSAQLVYKF